jgi:formate C-acetyltransferase
MPAGVNRAAFAKTLQAFAVFIRRHAAACARAGRPALAAICAHLAAQAPRTFHEALQLVWFIQIFLHAESNAAAISFGRLDQYLWPFLQKDFQKKNLQEEDALELLCCFFMKCCEGDESQNLLVGGGFAGRCQENPLSMLILKAARMVKVWQPSLSVRIGRQSSDKFWNAALSLAATGLGMPSFFNEPVVTAGLARLGIPADRAADWAIIGCYEAAPQGDSFPMTVAGGVNLPSLFQEFLETPAGQKGAFKSFLAAFKAFFRRQYEQKLLPAFIARWEEQQRLCPSPFESLCVTGCLESGLAAEEGGARFNLFGVNLLGLGTLLDSLLAIKKLIFDEQKFTLAQMRDQVRRNFRSRKLLLCCRAIPGRYGSDNAESNLLAREISAFLADTVISRPMPNGVRPYPGFFRFGADVGAQQPASADGRQTGDRLSYGCGPGIFLRNPAATAILNSAAHLAHASCACGNPLTLSLNKKDVAGRVGRLRLRQLVETYFAQGGFHLHFNIISAEELRRAKSAPDQHPDLTVRISGYSARFIALAPHWQDALIERAEKGM